MTIDRDLFEDKNYTDKNINYIWGYRMTVLRLLFLIATSSIFGIDGNKRAYLHRLEKELFE
ncbi:MAG: hypothetical protein J6B87_07345 [Clostridia bacterium]|nr:hypothetical protein [Clostridia bacterium]